MKAFYLKANARKSSEKLSQQTKKVIDYIQERYKKSILIIGMDIGYEDDDFIHRTVRFRVFYEGDFIKQC